MILVGLSELEQQGIAHSVAVASFMEASLAKFIGEFTSAAEFRSAQAEYAVAGAVGKELAPDQVAGVGVDVPGLHGRYPFPVHYHVLDGCVEQQFDVGLTDYCRINYVVPYGVALQGVVVEIAQLHLFQDACLLVLVLEHSDYTHAHLAGSVASKHGAVLDQHDLCAVAGCGNSSAHAGEASARDHQLGLEFHILDYLGILLREHSLRYRLDAEGQKQRSTCDYSDNLHNVQ